LGRGERDHMEEERQPKPRTKRGGPTGKGGGVVRRGLLKKEGVV